MVDRVTERTDGVTTERVTEHDGSSGTVIVDRGGGGGGGVGIAMVFVLIVLVAIAAIFLVNQNRNEAVKTDAITGAAKSVEKTADKIGTAADKAGDAIENTVK
jgi:uncharacterized membrane protein